MKSNSAIPNPEIRWAAIHDRLAQAAKAFRSAAESPEQAEEILAERARKLARVPSITGPEGGVIKLLRFMLTTESYGMETRYVREVFRLTAITPVPGFPDFLLGVTNLRGEVLPVYDLRALFALPAIGLTDRAQVIVCGEVKPELGFVADNVEAVIDLPLAELLPNSVLQNRQRQKCVKGVTREALVVLDGSALLSDPRLSGMSADQTPRNAERGNV